MKLQTERDFTLGMYIVHIIPLGIRNHILIQTIT